MLPDLIQKTSIQPVQKLYWHPRYSLVTGVVRRSHARQRSRRRAVRRRSM